MIPNFPLVRQPPGSNSCLPTAVRAVLLWQRIQVSPEQVSEWCYEDPDGCWLDQAMAGLQEQGFDVEALPQEDQDSVRAIVTDEEDSQPVIVTIQNPDLTGQMDHAVVITNIRRPQGREGSVEAVEYMDPLIGQIEEDTSGLFWVYWHFAGGFAYIIRP